MSHKIVVLFRVLLFLTISFMMMGLSWLPIHLQAATAVDPIIISATSDTLDDLDGQCSLREAFYNANNNTQYSSETGECTSGSASEMDVIRLQSGLTYTLILTDGSGSLKVFDDLRLESDDTLSTTIQMTVADERVLEIHDATVEIDNLVLSGGTTNGGGGGIWNQGILTLTHVLVQDNHARNGGGLYNQGTAVVIDSHIFSNTATINGGGIVNIAGGQITLDNTHIISNTANQNGGGLYHIDDQSTLILTNSPIMSNTATNGDGGGLYALADSDLRNGRWQGNRAPKSLGGGIYNGSAQLTGEQISFVANHALVGGGIYNTNGQITLHSGLVEDNQATTQGGGLYSGGSQANLLLNQINVDGNAAQSGGGIYLASGTTTTMTQSAIIYNEATATGGGILAMGTLTMGNVTISNNNADGLGGGLAIMANGMATAVNITLALNNTNLYQMGGFTVQNSLISGADQPSCEQIDVLITSLGHNLTDDDSCAGLDEVTDVITAELGLAPLDKYYSELPTHALLESSPALDAGDLTACEASPVNGRDQRDYRRPYGAACDIGAHEEQPPVQIYLPLTVKP